MLHGNQYGSKQPLVSVIGLRVEEVEQSYAAETQDNEQHFEQAVILSNLFVKNLKEGYIEEGARRYCLKQC